MNPKDRQGRAEAASMPVEAWSLDGDPLYRPMQDSRFHQEQVDKLREAAAIAIEDPTDIDAIIWMGRRNAYIGRYNRSIEIYSMGLELHPDNPRLLRHRGHRHLTTRQLDKALADFKAAARHSELMPDRVEQDGMPNRAGIPLTTTKWNIQYHLGLTYYLMGRLEEADRSLERCKRLSRHDDQIVACTYWRWLTAMQRNRQTEAVALLEPINREMEIIENSQYHRLLLLFKGEMDRDEIQTTDERSVLSADVQSATTGYGLAMWMRFNGNMDGSNRLLNSIVASSSWPAFGHIAAEAELAIQSRGFDHETWATQFEDPYIIDMP